jgi:hypothetical protein
MNWFRPLRSIIMTRTLAADHAAIDRDKGRRVGTPITTTGAIGEGGDGYALPCINFIAWIPAEVEQGVVATFAETNTDLVQWML